MVDWGRLNLSHGAGRQWNATLLQFSTKANDLFFVPVAVAVAMAMVKGSGGDDGSACVRGDVLLLHHAMGTFQFIDILLDLVHFLNLSADCGGGIQVGSEGDGGRDRQKGPEQW